MNFNGEYVRNGFSSGVNGVGQVSRLDREDGGQSAFQFKGEDL